MAMQIDYVQDHRPTTHFPFCSKMHTYTPHPDMIKTRCVIVGPGLSCCRAFEPHEKFTALIKCLLETAGEAGMRYADFTLYLARGGPNNEWLQFDSIEYGLIKRGELPSLVKAMMNDANKINPRQTLGDPTLELPTCSSIGWYGIQVLVELRGPFDLIWPFDLCWPSALLRFVQPKSLSYMDLDVKKHA